MNKEISREKQSKLLSKLSDVLSNSLYYEVEEILEARQSESYDAGIADGKLTYSIDCPLNDGGYLYQHPFNSTVQCSTCRREFKLEQVKD